MPMRAISSLAMSAPLTRDHVGQRRLRHVVGFGPARNAAERQLEDAGLVLPFSQRAEWLQAVGYQNSALFIVDCDERAQAAIGIGIGHSRSLPGHLIYRVDRVGASVSGEADADLLEGIRDATFADRRCIRLQVEVFEREPELRERLASTLQGLGFVRAPHTASYLRTPCLDLGPSEEALFAKVAASARRNVRAPAKRGFQLRTVEDPAYINRLEELIEEVFSRTGGTTREFPWAAILRASRASPNRSRVIGLFAPNDNGPSGLLAFAWGCVNGNYVTYDAGASTRNHDLGNMPLAYAPLWDLIAWAKRIGATWFDFGGVSTTTAAPTDDPLGGISDFKRFFCERIVDVGEDWILEPRPIRAMIARTFSAAVERVRR